MSRTLSSESWRAGRYGPRCLAAQSIPKSDHAYRYRARRNFKRRRTQAGMAAAAPRPWIPRKISRVISSVYVTELQLMLSSRSVVLTLREPTAESEDAQPGATTEEEPFATVKVRQAAEE